MLPIRIGTITFDWYPDDARVHRLVEAALDAGYAVDVICLKQPGEKRYQVAGGVQIYRMPMNRGFGHLLPMTVLAWCWFLLLAGVTITRLHLKHAYDVIHVHNIPDFLIFSTLIPKLLGAKVILDIQDVCPELMGVKANGRMRRMVIALARWQEHVSTSFADHVVTVGQPFAELLQRRGVLSKKLSIIINSADPKTFPASYRDRSEGKTSNRNNPLILMYHGTVAERNGLDIAIRALAMARQIAPDIRLDILGRGEHIPVLKQLAADLHVNDSVVFVGYRALEDVVKFVAHGDVGIIPYRNNEFMKLILPTKAYEFAWIHRPMIASNTPAIRSLFRPESLMLCDPSRPEEFAKAIITLYQHPEKRAKMVQDAYEDYKPHEWEPMAHHYQQLLATLACKCQRLHTKHWRHIR